MLTVEFVEKNFIKKLKIKKKLNKNKNKLKKHKILESIKKNGKKVRK